MGLGIECPYCDNEVKEENLLRIFDEVYLCENCFLELAIDHYK